jgi:hypothetical protein
MKSQHIRLLLLFAAVACLTGCGTVAALKQPFTRTATVAPVVLTIPAQTNTVAHVVEATTNTVGNVTTITPAHVTNYVTVTAERYVTNYTTNVSVAVNPALESALAVAQRVNQFNPTPTAPLVDLALVGISGALAFWARLKTRQANENAGIARTVILGIEEGASPETKAAIAKFSAAAGNAPQVNALVQKFTRT